MKNHPEHIAEGNSMGFLSDDGGETYNHCHMVSAMTIYLLVPTNRSNSGRILKLAI
jgi:hypothetical protein